MDAGLGLSIARGIVQAHGGRIELVPLPKGTCFRVYLPVEAETGDGGNGGTVPRNNRKRRDPGGRARHEIGRTGDGDDD